MSKHFWCEACNYYIAGNEKELFELAAMHKKGQHINKEELHGWAKK